MAMLAARATNLLMLRMLLTVQCVACLSRNDPRGDGKTVTYSSRRVNLDRLGAR